MCCRHGHTLVTIIIKQESCPKPKFNLVRPKFWDIRDHRFSILVQKELFQGSSINPFTVTLLKSSHDSIWFDSSWTITTEVPLPPGIEPRPPLLHDCISKWFLLTMVSSVAEFIITLVSIYYLVNLVFLKCSQWLGWLNFSFYANYVSVHWLCMYSPYLFDIFWVLPGYLFCC